MRDALIANRFVVALKSVGFWNVDCCDSMLEGVRMDGALEHGPKNGGTVFVEDLETLWSGGDGDKKIGSRFGRAENRQKDSRGLSFEQRHGDGDGDGLRPRCVFELEERRAAGKHPAVMTKIMI